jgi:hypothetical protein
LGYFVVASPISKLFVKLFVDRSYFKISTNLFDIEQQYALLLVLQLPGFIEVTKYKSLVFVEIEQPNPLYGPILSFKILSVGKSIHSKEEWLLSK